MEMDNHRIVEPVSEKELHVRKRALPHWEVDDAYYFVTFRLADSLPKGAIEHYTMERKRLLEAMKRATSDQLSLFQKQLWQLFNDRIERYLDAGIGECLLRDERATEVVANALRHFDGERYRLEAWCLMPNHVHVVLWLEEHGDLERTLHSWKSFTANGINKALGREGPVWQREYYDHLVRSDSDLNRCIDYTIENPAKANMTNWKWVWESEARRACRLEAGATFGGVLA